LYSPFRFRAKTHTLTERELTIHTSAHPRERPSNDLTMNSQEQDVFFDLLDKPTSVVLRSLRAKQASPTPDGPEVLLQKLHLAIEENVRNIGGGAGGGAGGGRGRGAGMTRSPGWYDAVAVVEVLVELGADVNGELVLPDDVEDAQQAEAEAEFFDLEADSEDEWEDEDDEGGEGGESGWQGGGFAHEVDPYDPAEHVVTPLFRAACQGYFDLSVKLLDCGAHLDWRTPVPQL
jgi:hypothetical protein